MEISPQGKDAIKSALCQFMSEDEAERFIDLEYALDVIKQGQLCWQAPASIGIHAEELYLSAQDDSDSAALPNLIGLSLEPLEALLQFLLARPDEETLRDERARMLFHTRFALGLLLLAKGEKQRAKALLREVAGTKVSSRGGAITSGREIIWCTADIAQAKWHTAYYLLLECGRQKALDHEEVLYALAEAAACAPSGTSLIIPLALGVLSNWTATCEKTDASQEYDFPDFGWLDLFTGAAELLSFCQEADTAGNLPNKCEADSPQYAAWKFGQIAGRFAVQDPRWSTNPHEKTNAFYDAFGDQDFGFLTWEEEQSYRALRTVEALLSEFDVDRDWQKARQRYVEMWRRSDRWRGAVLSEISPESDLYWAIRIGFADTILETPGQQALVPTKIAPQTGVPDPEGLSRDDINALLLHKIDWQTQKIQEILLQHLPPSTDIHTLADRRQLDAYGILSRLEQDLRKLIENKLRESYGDRWWKQGVPEKVRTDCEERKQIKEKPSESSYLPICYAHFNDYKEIILKRDNWKTLFRAIFANKSEVETCFSWVVRVRDPVAHIRPVSDDHHLQFRAAARRLQSAITRTIDPGP